MDHILADVLCGSDYALGRRALDPEHFLAAAIETGHGIYGLSGYDVDGDLYYRRGAGTDRRVPPVDHGAEWRASAGGSVRPAGHREWRSGKDALLLVKAS